MDHIIHINSITEGKNNMPWEGYIGSEWDPSTNTWDDSSTAADIGEYYYSTQGSNPESTAMFWFDLLQGPLGYESGEAPSVGPFEAFMGNWGGYLPQDFDLGYANIDRQKRLAETGRGLFREEFQLEAADARKAVGTSGFASSGYQDKVGDDIRRRFKTHSQAKELGFQEGLRGIYGQQGQSIL